MKKKETMQEQEIKILKDDMQLLQNRMALIEIEMETWREDREERRYERFEAGHDDENEIIAAGESRASNDTNREGSSMSVAHDQERNDEYRNENQERSIEEAIDRQEVREEEENMREVGEQEIIEGRIDARRILWRDYQAEWEIDWKLGVFMVKGRYWPENITLREWLDQTVGKNNTKIVKCNVANAVKIYTRDSLVWNNLWREKKSLFENEMARMDRILTVEQRVKRNKLIEKIKERKRMIWPRKMRIKIELDKALLDGVWHVLDENTGELRKEKEEEDEEEQSYYSWDEEEEEL